MRAMKLNAALFAVLLAVAGAAARRTRPSASTRRPCSTAPARRCENATIVVQGSKITSIETGGAANADLRSRTADDHARA